MCERYKAFTMAKKIASYKLAGFDEAAERVYKKTQQDTCEICGKTGDDVEKRYGMMMCIYCYCYLTG
jgi:hypothetical protein